MIDFILYFFIALVTICMVVLCFKNISEEKIKIDIWLIIILIVGSLITTGLFYLDITFIKNMYSIIFFTLVFKYISKKSLKELLYYAFLIWLYGLAIDLLIMLIISILGLDTILASIKLIYAKTICSTIMALCLLAMSLSKRLKKFTNNIIEKILRVKTSIILDFVFIIILIWLNVLCVFNIEKLTFHIFAIIIFSLIGFLVYTVIEKNVNLIKLKQVNNWILKNNDFFIKLDTDYRSLKHNLTSQLVGIKSVADKKTKELIDDLIQSYNSKFISSTDINKIPNGINGIIYEKFYSFNRKDIKLAVVNEINSNLIDILRPRTYNNLCETIGVLIDNALEAAETSDEKSILIDFFEEKDSLTIKIFNTFSNNIDIDKIGNLDYSTKGKNHGIGLFSIFIRNDLKIRNSIINNLYLVEIKIKKAF